MIKPNIAHDISHLTVFSFIECDFNNFIMLSCKHFDFYQCFKNTFDFFYKVLKSHSMKENTVK